MMIKNILITILFVLSVSPIYAQIQTGGIGINTTSPQSTLDVAGNLESTDIDGLQPPRLTRAELTLKGNSLYGSNHRGTLLFITDISGGDTAGPRANITSTGYYYFDGSAWIKLATVANSADPWNVTTTTTPATHIAQNVYRTGGVAIGVTNVAIVPVPKFYVDYTVGSISRYIGLPAVGDSPGVSSGIGLRFRAASDLFDWIGIRQTATVGTLWERISLKFNALNENFAVSRLGNVGINLLNASATHRLHVNGAVKIVDGTEGMGKVLTSNAVGLGTWQPRVASPDGIGVYRNRVACTGTLTQVIADPNVTANSTILFTYENPVNNTVVTIGEGSRIAGTSFTVFFNSAPLTTSFINYVIIP